MPNIGHIQSISKSIILCIKTKRKIEILGVDDIALILLNDHQLAHGEFAYCQHRQFSQIAQLLWGQCKTHDRNKMKWTKKIKDKTKQENNVFIKKWKPKRFKAKEEKKRI